jgi:Ran GTPase-activating protein (RanGAP) involved in mRNA processing and transport
VQSRHNFPQKSFKSIKVEDVVVLEMTPASIYRYCFRTDAITSKTELPDDAGSWESEDSGSSQSESNDLSDEDETTKADEEETKEPFVKPVVNFIDPT